MNIRDCLENWVINSIKPIDISCECSNQFDIPDYRFDEIMIDLMLNLMALGVLFVIIERSRKVQ